jgi:hypothetical protein
MRSLKIILVPAIFSIPVLVVSTVMALSQTAAVWLTSVHTSLPPTSQTSYISRLTHDGDGTYTLRVAGTVGVEYFVEATTSLMAPEVWEAVPGSTHLVTESHEQWEVIVTAQEPDFWFFRSAVVRR